MKIDKWYSSNFEHQLKGRYITLESISLLLDKYKKEFEISIPSTSVLGEDIPLIKIGNGSKIVLGWSQMHGNESTTTKGLFDFLKFISQKELYQKEIELFLQKHTFYIFPMLNPDGAKLYTRENANGVDLNRDAQNLSQKESQCLRDAFDNLKPSLCLNLHDQRSIYGFKDGMPATVSFLSPAADKNRTVTDSRKVAMGHIVKMSNLLQTYIPGQVGRYDDSFNEACVGDTFQKEGVPTILFEAGHFKDDYQREKSREFIFYSILSLFDILETNSKPINFKNYFDIPQNLKNHNDIILRNVKLTSEKKLVSVAIQYQEILKDGAIIFSPIIVEIGSLKNKIGHKEISFESDETLTNSQENLTVGMDISKYFEKSGNSLIYFQ